MQGIFNGNARRLLLIVAHLLEKGNMIYFFYSMETRIKVGLFLHLHHRLKEMGNRLVLAQGMGSVRWCHSFTVPWFMLFQGRLSMTLLTPPLS